MRPELGRLLYLAGDEANAAYQGIARMPTEGTAETG
jgi:hypothetical protein